MVRKILTGSEHDVIIDLRITDNVGASAFHAIAFCALKILREFDSLEKSGVPYMGDARLSSKEWESIIGKIIIALEMIVADDRDDWDAVEEGMDLFHKYFFDLWD